MTADMEMLKARLKATWESGDYGVLAKYLEPGALEFLERLPLRPGVRMLDVACGTGHLTIAAARRSVCATGIDIASNLVTQARANARRQGIVMRIDEGDAEDLPYPDSSFDVVVSLMGSMFAPRPELVAAEMLRVCRPGGRIAMGNWTAEGHIGQMFRVLGKYVESPARVPSPLLWGDEATCRQRLAGVGDMKITRRMYPLEYPFPPARMVDLFVNYYGPASQAYSSLTTTARKAFCADLAALWVRNNKAADGTTRIMAEYVEVVGERRVEAASSSRM